MGMVEIRERTVVKEPDGSEKTLLPGRITQTEAELYGLTSDVKTTDEEAPKAKTRKKT